MQYFPSEIYPDCGSYAGRYFQLLGDAARTVSPESISAAASVLVDAAKSGRTIFSCGNGGSAAIANHLVCDCLKGVRAGSYLKPRVVSLSATVELITAIVNDIGSNEMFSYQLETLAGEGDVLIAISSSGASPNIISALKLAKARGMRTIAMTGFTGGEAAKLADVALHVDAHNYGVVEDTHQSLMHILAQYMRHSHLEDPAQIGTMKF